jgi:hypothetical protein
MKLKILAVTTLFVLGCSAAFAQGSVTLGFTSTNGQLYCNYEVLQWSGLDNFYLTGTDNNSYCDEPNVPISGFKVGSGAPVFPASPAYEYTYITEDNDYYYQWTTITATKPSKLLHHYGWYVYADFSGLEFLGNYGYLSASYPGSGSSKPVSHQSTVEAAKEALRTKGILK